MDTPRPGLKAAFDEFRQALRDFSPPIRKRTDGMLGMVERIEESKDGIRVLVNAKWRTEEDRRTRTFADPKGMTMAEREHVGMGEQIMAQVYGRFPKDLTSQERTEPKKEDTCMAALVWDKTGSSCSAERLYKNGVDHGVLHVHNANKFKELKLPIRGNTEFVFADLDDIGRNMKSCYDVNLDYVNLDLYKFEYVKDGICVKVGIPVCDCDETKRDDIVHVLAKAYDKAMIERKTKMTSQEFDRLSNRVRSIGGSITMYAEDIDGTRDAYARIVIPVSSLSQLHTVYPKALFESKNVRNAIRIPEIKDVKFFNDRATVVTFADGTQTRSVCDKEDHFSKDVGIAYCLFKRFLGGEKAGHAQFNDLMRQARKAFEDRKAEEKEAQKEAVRESRWKAKRMEAAKRRKEKKRQEKVDLIAEAIRKSQD